MPCVCDPTPSVAASGGCCMLADSVPTGQFVRWTGQEVASPHIKIKAYQLGNATPTELTPASNQRFWLYSLHVSTDTVGQLDVYWSIGGAAATINSYIFRGEAPANDLRRYEGPTIPLPLSAEIYALTEVAGTVNAVGYGLLETI